MIGGRIIVDGFSFRWTTTTVETPAGPTTIRRVLIEPTQPDGTKTGLEIELRFTPEDLESFYDESKKSRLEIVSAGALEHLPPLGGGAG